MINNMAYFGVGLIAVMFIIFVMNRKNKPIQELAPSLLITTGIFFTFIGIAIGLVHFNADNVDTSLPPLLNGIKTAFWASASGVFFALIIKLLDSSPIRPNKPKCWWRYSEASKICTPRSPLRMNLLL